MTLKPNGLSLRDELFLLVFLFLFVLYVISASPF